MNIPETLEKILPYVRNPGRYIGGEANQVVKAPEKILASMALVFPDAYELGMSHNGTKVLYHVLNREVDLAAERAFAPMPDMAEQMMAKGIPLYTLESYRPVSSFSAVGFSLQTELNYTNIPFLLELSGLKAFRKDRSEADPFIIGGGPCMANPEPVADFFDFFVIGDGEILAPQILRLIGEGRMEGLSKEAILQKLTVLKGIYVPQFLEMRQSPKGQWVPSFDGSQGPYIRAKGIQRAWVEVLNRDDYPIRNLIPHMKLVHNRFSVEVMRGCTQGCRFCQAGYWYRPNRELKADDVVDLAIQGLAATGENELGLLSLSTADYGPVEKVVDALINRDEFEEVDLSLPSLRANSFGQGLAQKVAAMGGSKSATFAPETGSERLRKIINKTISDQDMYDAAEGVFKNGFHNIKLYTMVGLPTENLDDMQAFCGLIENLYKIGQKYGRKNTVHANIGILVPKPFTPMQWVGFMPEAKVMEHIRYVREYFRWNRNIRITWADYGISLVESFYSRGDRSLSDLIYKAYKSGQIFESFSEHFTLEGWRKIWAENNYPIEEVFQERELTEIFPWDFIHAGANKGFLKLEYKKMFLEDAAPIPDCKWGDCQKCGIPGNGADTQLSPMPEKHAAPNRDIESIRALAKERQDRQAGQFPFKIIYAKTGLSKFIAHQATLELFEKGFRRLGLKLKHSSGFSRRPILKNTGALPLGMASQREMLIAVFREAPAFTASEFCLKLTDMLPEGMSVMECEALPNNRMPYVDTVVYSSGINKDISLQDAYQRYVRGEMPAVIHHRDKDIELAGEVSAMWMEGEELFMKAITHPSGSSISPYAVYAALFQTEPDLLRSTGIYKVSFTTSSDTVLKV